MRQQEKECAPRSPHLLFGRFGRSMPFVLFLQPTRQEGRTRPIFFFSRLAPRRPMLFFHFEDVTKRVASSADYFFKGRVWCKRHKEAWQDDILNFVGGRCGQCVIFFRFLCRTISRGNNMPRLMDIFIRFNCLFSYLKKSFERDEEKK